MMGLELTPPPASAIQMRRNAMWRKIRRDHPTEKLRRAGRPRIRRVL